jgi:thiamine pyrophosphokinase
MHIRRADVAARCVVMKMGICYIVGAAECVLPHIDKSSEDYLIAADGGLAALDAMGIKPDAVLGDFDSLGYVPKKGGVKVFPREKDFTDTELAVEYGIELGYSSFVIFGGLGGKSDLEYANYQLVRKLARRGARGILSTPERTVTAIFGDKARFPAKMSGRISVFAPSGATGVREKGLKYELDGYAMESCSAIGVSNEFVGVDAEISCESGDLVLMWDSCEYEFLLKK